MIHKILTLLSSLLITALALGAQDVPTHVKIFLKGQDPRLIPIGEIDSIRFEVSAHPSDQMPLINFNYATDLATIEAYEAKLGRQLRSGVNLNNDTSQQPNPLPAYVNLSLDLIPIVSYGLNLEALESNAIIALARESVKDCPRLQSLIAALGFKEIYHDETSYQYKKDDVTIILQHWPNSEWGTKSCITIMRPMPPAPVAKAHEFVALATDIPSFEVLMTGQPEQIIAFEQQAGYRDSPTDLGAIYLPFTTKADRINDSNIKIAFYWLDEPHITGIFNAISSVDEALTNSQIHEWAELNGFEGEWTRVVEHNSLTDVDVVYATVSSDKATLRIFYENRRMKFEIVPKKS